MAESVPDVSSEIAQAANHLARYVHRNGSVYSVDLQKMITGNRRTGMDQLLDHAVENRWLTVNGSQYRRVK